jgi:6-pyruvoyltetrahydropterin/6-carboxytetrahydropterin synthase
MAVEPADAQGGGYSMILELSQEFYFEAAHTLDREYDTESSRRVHGHTYYAEVIVRGEPDSVTFMITDLATLRTHIEQVRSELDHHLLDEVEGLGKPTIEALSMLIARRLSALEPRVVAVRVSRKASGDSCLCRLPASEP